jgi:hypothetical protein
VVLLINLTTEPWNDRDNKIVERAKVVCSTDERHKGFPCVRSVTKLPEQVYRVICGVEE